MKIEHIYEVRPRNDKRGVDLISDALPFGRLCRPVIYQPESEFQELSDFHKWRHMRYEPNRATPIDFTWEREWRLKCERLDFQPSDVAILIPTEEWAHNLISDHEGEQDYEVEMYSCVLGRTIAEQYREDFPWRVYVLGVGSGSSACSR